MYNERLSESENLLKELVEIDSQVGNLAGIRTVQEYLAIELKCLGFEVDLIENQVTRSAPLLHAKLETSSNAPRVTFLGHSDVVTSPRDNPFSVIKDLERISGSGVADDKGGVVTCLSAIKNFLGNIENLFFNINIIISPSEETGSIGFHDLFRSLGEISDVVLGLEPALNCGSVINGRSGNRWYKLEVTGISAHSGRFGEEHLNASHYMAKIIAKLHDLNDEKNSIRVNVGSFGGGEGAYNIICGSAWAKIDTRFPTLEARDYLQEQLEKIIISEQIYCPYSLKNAKVSLEIEDDCPPMETQILASNILGKKIIKSLSIAEQKIVQCRRTGGAADINYFQNKGCVLLDGLGPKGHGMHTNSEYICRKSLETRINALENILNQFNTHKFIGRNPCNSRPHRQELTLQSL